MIPPWYTDGMNPDLDPYHRADGGKYFDGDNYQGTGTAFNAAVFGAAGAVAGKRFYDKNRPYADTPELLGASIRFGAIAAIRWKVWFVTVLWWLASIPVWLFLSTPIPESYLSGITDYEAPGGPRAHSFTGEWLHGVTALPLMLLVLQVFLGFFAIGVTYNQIIRESLSKQGRWFYRAMLPFDRIAGRVPWWVLHSLVVVPFAILIISYNQT